MKKVRTGSTHLIEVRESGGGGGVCVYRSLADYVDLYSIGVNTSHSDYVELYSIGVNTSHSDYVELCSIGVNTSHSDYFELYSIGVNTSHSDYVELYWAIQRSWFARVNALCNLSRKKSREVAAHFRADF